MEKRFYEILIALEPSVSVADADALLARLTAMVAELKGETRAVEKLGVRRLSFRVKGRTDAAFFLITTHMPVSVVPVIEQVLRMHEGVIRYMTTRLDPSLVAAATAPATGVAAAPASPAAPAPVAPAPQAPAAGAPPA